MAGPIGLALRRLFWITAPQRSFDGSKHLRQRDRCSAGIRHGGGDILGHTRQLIPTGRMLLVEDSPMDFLLLPSPMADLKAVHAAVDEQAAPDALDSFGVRNTRKSLGPSGPSGPISVPVSSIPRRCAG